MKSIKPNLKNLSFFESTTSTQDEAKNWLKLNSNSTEPQWFWALHQSAGRGRQNKKWLNTQTQNTLMLTAALPFKSFEGAGAEGALNWGLLPLFSGLVLWKLFSPLQSDLFIKWPNDLGVLDSRGNFCKMAGILCERFGREQAHHMVGWGVNISGLDKNLGDPTQKDFISVSLEELCSRNPNDLTQVSLELDFWCLELIKAFEAEIRLWIEDPVFYESEALELLKTQAMGPYWGLKGTDPEGQLCRTLDLDDSGNLIVEPLDNPNQHQTLRAGEFRLSRKI